MKCLYLLLSFLFLSCSGRSSTAENTKTPTLNVVLVRVQGRDALTEQELLTIWGGTADDYWSFLLTDLNLTEVVTAPELNEDWFYGITNYQQTQKLGYCEDWVRRNLGIKEHTFYHCVFPPIRHNGDRYFGGLATSICSHPDRRFSLSQGGMWSSHTPSRRRDQGSGWIVGHEICHVIGCTHKEGENIMDPAAGRFFDSHFDLGLTYWPVSKDELYSCTGKRKTVALKKLRREYRKLKAKGKRRKAQRVLRQIRIARKEVFLSTTVGVVIDPVFR